ncbi:MAG: DUF5050 domain-containing protein [Clostridia bacterium]|nr:DUF5050 domain-containing protein [Clostridia bacterium]
MNNSFFKKIALILISVAMVSTAGLVACTPSDGGGDTPPPHTHIDTNNDYVCDGCGETLTGGTSDPTLENITGVSFANATYTYDGNIHTLLVSGNIPSGVDVSYQNNMATNAGEYTATATLSGEGYNPLTLTATLTINKATMSGITFGDESFEYDGNPKTLEIVGQPPQGSNITYTCEGNSGMTNTATDSGTYNITATITNPNYNTLTLTATLTINKATMSGISFGDESVEYDGNPKTLEIVGQPPQGSSITYTCEGNSGMTNTATDSGTYNITVTITNPNYHTLTLTAKMVIKGSDAERHILYSDGVLYFANALDKDYLYAYDGSEVSRISSDIPYNFTMIGDDIYFRSKSLFSSIKSISDGSLSSIAGESGEYLVSDGTNLYFVKNALTQSSSGIYKLTLNGSEEPTITLLSAGKAKYLQYYNGYLYFADGANGYKLSKMSTSGTARTLVVDEKISTLTLDNGYLFYTVDNLLGNYIASYKISNGATRKLTIDAGANLTLIGNKLYYVNVDLLTSSAFGDGIYYVNAYPTVDNSLPGTKLVGDDTYSSLTKISDDKVAYYRVSDQMLIIHNLSNNTMVEVLDGFEIPEYTPLSLGSKTLEYNGVLYYLDLYKDKCLYAYYPSTGTSVKISSNKVVDFSIIGDYLYINTVSWIVNNDMYRINLKTGGVAEKISTYDCNDICGDGTNVFFVEKNAGGFTTAIHVIKSDGTHDMMYSSGVNNLRYYDGYIYFENGNKLYKMPTTGYVQDEATLVFDGPKVNVFEISDGVVYFRETYGISRCLSKVNVDGSGYARWIMDVDPVEISNSGNKVYIYSDTISNAKAGLYVVNTNSNTATKIMERTVSGVTYYTKAITVIENDVYFVNYLLGGVGGDSHLYKINTDTKEITKIA